jgi:hypothetical protein
MTPLFALTVVSSVGYPAGLHATPWVGVHTVGPPRTGSSSAPPRTFSSQMGNRGWFAPRGPSRPTFLKKKPAPHRPFHNGMVGVPFAQFGTQQQAVAAPQGSCEVNNGGCLPNLKCEAPSAGGGALMCVYEHDCRVVQPPVSGRVSCPEVAGKYRMQLRQADMVRGPTAAPPHPRHKPLRPSSDY